MSSVGSLVVGSAFSRLVNVEYDGVCHILMSAFVSQKYQQEDESRKFSEKSASNLPHPPPPAKN